MKLVDFGLACVIVKPTPIVTIFVTKRFKYNVTIFVTMTSSGDITRYQKLYEEVHERTFSTPEVAEHLSMSLGHAKVFLHRLTKALAASRIARGTYVLTEPVRWFQVQGAMGNHPELGAFFERLGPALNDLDLVVLHGSLARGESTPQSDIDLLIVTRNPSKIKSSTQYSVNALTPHEFYEQLHQDPLFLYAALYEGTLILGDSLADFVKGLGIDRELLREKLLQSLAMNRQWHKLLETGADQETEWNAIYSATLRLRTSFITRSLLYGASWKRDELEAEFLRYYNDAVRFKKYYGIYEKIRDGKKVSEKTHRNAVKKYVRAVERYTRAVLEESYG